MKIILGIGIGCLLTISSYALYTTYSAPDTSPAPTNEPQLLDVFRITLEDEVAKRSTVTERGYTPTLLLETFPGLSMTDFEAVAASGGVYTIEAGSLLFVREEGGLIPETVGGLNRAGYQTLLDNVTKRLKIDLSTDGTLTDVVTALTRVQSEERE